MKNWKLAIVCRVLIAINFIVFTAAAPAFSVADTNLPAMGEGAEMTSSEERRLGEDIAREIYRDPQFVEDPILFEYVNSIWLELMQAALACARKRVVLKWPRKGPPMPGLRKPSHQIVGKTLRYDVFMTPSTERIAP